MIVVSAPKHTTFSSGRVCLTIALVHLHSIRRIYFLEGRGRGRRTRETYSSPHTGYPSSARPGTRPSLTALLSALHSACLSASLLTPCSSRSEARKLCLEEVAAAAAASRVSEGGSAAARCPRPAPSQSPRSPPLTAGSCGATSRPAGGAGLPDSTHPLSPPRSRAIRVKGRPSSSRKAITYTSRPAVMPALGPAVFAKKQSSPACEPTNSSTSAWTLPRLNMSVDCGRDSAPGNEAF
mmetsp:Transcript_40670/g.132864  ORF Transcript_40670/g.132864 Transcript_40670/m.132864 type:complete len:238 (+) Transcript_40670:553-1266(+)